MFGCLKQQDLGSNVTHFKVNNMLSIVLDDRLSQRIQMKELLSIQQQVGQVLRQCRCIRAIQRGQRHSHMLSTQTECKSDKQRKGLNQDDVACEEGGGGLSDAHKSGLSSAATRADPDRLKSM